jgi:lipopolysaccharide transport system permease protein
VTSAQTPGDASGAESWTKIIRADSAWFEIPWAQLWRYKDLIGMLALRDISASYKQTVLGPFWFVLQPVLVTAVFSYLFGRMGKFGTDNVPHYLFYMSGLVPWAFFAECVNKASATFVQNAQLFNKVYFPRLVVPLAAVLTNLVPLAVQFSLFVIGLGFYLLKDNPFIHPNWLILSVPLLFVQLALLALGIGCTVAAMTRRFRDLAFGVKIGLQLWMFGSAIVFPLTRIDPSDRWIFFLNPVVPAIEWFRIAFLGVSLIEPAHIVISWGITLAVFLGGIVLFNRAERTAMDTV